MFYGFFSSIPAEEELPFDPTDICDYPDTVEEDSLTPDWVKMLDQPLEAAK